MSGEKKRIRRIMLLSTWNREGVESYLEEKAAKGWRLRRMGELFWEFEKDEPAKLHYSVVYFSKASSFEAAASDRQLMLQELCEHAGWKPAAENGPVLVFFHEGEDPVPVETDEESSLAAVHETAKKHLLPLYGFLALMGLIQCLTGAFGLRFFTDPWSILASNAGLSAGFFSFLSFVLPVIGIIHYLLWHKKARRMIDEGNSGWQKKGPVDLRAATVMCMMAELVFMLLSFSVKLKAVLLIISGVLGVIVICWSFSRWLKKVKAGKNINRGLTFFVSIAGSLLMAGLIITVMVQEIEASRRNRTNVEYREINGWKQEIYHDELPLTAEELYTTEYSGYSCEIKKKSSSVLTEYMQAVQKPGKDALSEPSVSYRVAIVKVPFVYRVVKDLMEKELSHDIGRPENEESGWEKHLEVEAAPWGADKAYRLSMGEVQMNRFLLCYEDRIVEIDLDRDTEPTQQQMRIVGEKLGKVKQ